jgi:tripartite-type tricarboxylate transporter receptor subunit TctC
LSNKYSNLELHRRDRSTPHLKKNQDRPDKNQGGPKARHAMSWHPRSRSEKVAIEVRLSQPQREEGNMIRRIGMLAALSGIVLSPGLAPAQVYPSKPITIVVPYAVGGAADVIGRAVALRLTEAWGRPFVIENKAGGNSQIGAAYVAKSAPDGYTLLATADVTFVINPYLYRTLPYDPVKDFAPISGLGVVNEALVVHPSTPLQTVGGLIALAKSRPGDLNYGSGGIGSGPHLSMELLQSAASVKLNAVQYKGAGPALTDVIAGHIPMMFINVGLVVQPWKAGQLRAIGIGSSERLRDFPGLPTIAESLPGFRATFWFGLFAPARTPKDIVQKINAAVRGVLADPRFREQFLAPNFYEPMIGSPEQLAATVRSDADKWRKIIKDAKLTSDE